MNSAERKLWVIAVLKAYATGNAEELERLITNGPKTGYKDLIEFTISLIREHSTIGIIPYLDYLTGLNAPLQSIRDCELDL